MFKRAAKAVTKSKSKVVVKVKPKKKKFNVFSWTLYNDKRTFVMNVVAYTSVNNSTGATAGSEYAIPLNFPTFRNFQIASNAPSWAQFGTFAGKFTTANGLFDEYHVVKLRVTFEPQNVETGTINLDIPFNVYMIHDPDDVGIPGTVTDAAMIENGRRPLNFADGKKVSVTINQRKGMPWLNTSVNVLANNAPGVSTLNQTNLTPTIYESIKVMFPNLGTATTIGRLYVQWMVIFRGVVNT